MHLTLFVYKNLTNCKATYHERNYIELEMKLDVQLDIKRGTCNSLEVGKYEQSDDGTEHRECVADNMSIYNHIFILKPRNIVILKWWLVLIFLL